jgi:hypothetical protein
LKETMMGRFEDVEAGRTKMAMNLPVLARGGAVPRVGYG